MTIVLATAASATTSTSTTSASSSAALAITSTATPPSATSTISYGRTNISSLGKGAGELLTPLLTFWSSIILRRSCRGLLFSLS